MSHHDDKITLVYTGATYRQPTDAGCVQSQARIRWLVDKAKQARFYQIDDNLLASRFTLVFGSPYVARKGKI